MRSDGPPAERHTVKLPLELARRAYAAVAEDRRLLLGALVCGLAAVIVYRLVLLLALTP